MIHVLILLLSLGGFLALLLALPRHQRDWMRRTLTAKVGRRLRCGGMGLLVLALAVAGIGFGWGQGAIIWFGWMTVAAALTVTANMHRERIAQKDRR